MLNFLSKEFLKTFFFAIDKLQDCDCLVQMPFNPAAEEILISNCYGVKLGEM